jgi:hypothetical protein
MPDLYKPYGTRCEWSYRPDPGEPWMVVADLWVTQVTLDRPEGEWTVECVDASGMMDEDNIVPAYPWAVVPGETIEAAVGRLIRRTFPGARITVAAGAATSVATPVPDSFDVKDRRSPWELLDALTDLAGCDVHITPDEAYVLRRVPDVAATAVDVLAADRNMVGYTLNLNSAWNTVALSYEDRTSGQNRTVTGTWQDTRPDSPLSVARLGRRITLWESREGTPTQSQADAAARVVGARAAGLARALTVDTLPRPWLEPGDTVAVTFQGGPVEELMLITAAEHDAAGHTSRFGLRNNRYVSQLEV